MYLQYKQKFQKSKFRRKKLKKNYSTKEPYGSSVICMSLAIHMNKSYGLIIYMSFFKKILFLFVILLQTRTSNQYQQHLAHTRRRRRSTKRVTTHERGKIII